jgi:SAM-dependent methyltransferase
MLSDCNVPLPPERIAARGVPLDPSNPLDSYLRSGREARTDIDLHLGPEWSWESKRVLDFGCASGRVLRHFVDEASTVAEFHGCDVDGPSVEWLRESLSPPFHVLRNESDPPLPYEAQSFDLIYAWSVFTHLYSNWTTWLLEMHRLLVEDGILIASMLGPGMSMAIAAEPWEEDRIGMNVLGMGEGKWSEAFVLHSEWWLRAHWGRAFEIVALDPGDEASGGHGIVMMRRRDVSLTPGELEAPEPDEPREFAALQHNVYQLFRGSLIRATVEARHKGMYDEVVSSASWRFTRPLRALAAFARKARARSLAGRDHRNV